VEALLAEAARAPMLPERQLAALLALRHHAATLPTHVPGPSFAQAAEHNPALAAEARAAPRRMPAIQGTAADRGPLTSRPLSAAQVVAVLLERGTDAARGAAAAALWTLCDATLTAQLLTCVTAAADRAELPVAAVGAFLSGAMSQVQSLQVMGAAAASGEGGGGGGGLVLWDGARLYLSSFHPSVAAGAAQDGAQQGRMARLLFKCIARLVAANPAYALEAGSQAEGFCVQFSRIKEAAELYVQLAALQGE
jgi:hypothetical protein